MSIEEVEALLREARDRDVRLWVAQGKLQFHAAKGALTDSLRNRLRGKKDLIVRALAGPVFSRRAPMRSVPILESSHEYWNAIKGGAYDLKLIHGTRFTVRVDGPFEMSALRAGIDSMVVRHSILRARLVDDERGPRFVMDCSRDVLLRIEDLSPQGGSVSEEQVCEAVGKLVWQDFDVAKGPLFRAFVVRVSSVDHIVGFVMHHFISDFSSVCTLAEELLAGYASFNKPAPASKGAPPLQYSDYLLAMNEWIRGGGVQLRLSYWKWRLTNAPPTRLPPDFAVEPDRMDEIIYLPFEVEKTTARELRGLAQEKGVTLFIVLLAAYMSTLAHLARLSDITVWLVYSGRNDPSLNGMVGQTVDLIALRIGVERSMSFAKLLERVQETWVDAYRHYVPFYFVGSLMKEIGASPIAPLFNFIGEISVARNAPDPFAGRARRFEVFEPPSTSRASVSVMPAQRMQLWTRGPGICGAIGYFRALYKTETISHMARSYCRSLVRIARDPSQTLDECLNDEQLPPMRRIS